MISALFPVKKLRRNGKCVLLGALLLVGVVAVVSNLWMEVAVPAGSISDVGTGWRNNLFGQRLSPGIVRENVNASHPLEDSGFMKAVWKPEYQGRANLHVFEDWCGSSTDRLRHNLHYPLYPHSRITVNKLAVSPQWTNYGLRIFGYLHPYTDGEFVFALSSDDNSEFWLSTDESPSNLQLLAWVGKTGSEWTAPGEFEKYSSQISNATQLSAHLRYFFEVIHKQNDKGTDHVEVAWTLLNEDLKFLVIESKYISLYVDESALRMDEVAHIPQTVPSHPRNVSQKHDTPTLDLLREDPRNTFDRAVPLLDNSFLQGLLPDCSYKPSYTINFPLQRYQGIHYVHWSYVYPNDYTRLTHMEGLNSCFYKPRNKTMFGFSRFMKLDPPEDLEKKNTDYSFQKRVLTWNDSTMKKSPYSSRPKSEMAAEKNLHKSAKGPNLKSPPPPPSTRKKLVPKQHINSKWTDVKMTYIQTTQKSLQPLNIKVANQEELRRDTREIKADTSREEEEDHNPHVFDTKVGWSQTFQIRRVDLQSTRSDLQFMRSDRYRLNCKVLGNLLLHSSDAMPVAKAFVAQLNKKHKDPFTLLRVVNVEKRLDGAQGSRYLLELELKDTKGQLRRLSHYIYVINRRHRTRPPGQDLVFQWPEAQPVLCNPVGFRWNPKVMVHFVLPVKNQARWVRLLIDNMAALFKTTGDANFNLIIADYSSTDMDVRAALEKSSLPRYHYVKLSGNFKRSAGLQAGIDLINDDHSIVFLCDLHIHFPPSIIDSIRKHCVEGFMAFAPILMRLDCGVTPLEARGYWEVQGFGLMGIYKSDLDAVGGMNTKEFTESWGGEDWELLDRILQAGLEVERIHLRNLFHHYHSKRGMWNHRMS
ncbi:beta-1,4-N-acetylgalactosaminyltransferase 3 isoform X1 [Syngnathus typhle]|uniref:beta-1,4-N-acetylgalactosaminyltransferase 3 isoform X1 n=1 Tax=Syngnathus typhle TaxID=161592 RepID=UPI002A6A5CA4|nr:beta-1,4-N-acetylgalactosaminyltransferase 3 isoform X1 [Syngnathus typhle]